MMICCYINILRNMAKNWEQANFRSLLHNLATASRGIIEEAKFKFRFNVKNYT